MLQSEKQQQQHHRNNIEKKWILLALICVVVSIFLGSTSYYYCYESIQYNVAWTIAQWLPIRSIRNNINDVTWEYWESRSTSTSTSSNTFLQQQEQYSKNTNSTEPKTTDEDNNNYYLPIPTVDVQKHRNNNNLLSYLNKEYGYDWRKRPLLLKNLWTEYELQDERRRFTVKGLLKENLTIPYFRDARKQNALTPDGIGSIKDIIYNITNYNMPHKIGTQLMVKTYPELIYEVAPNNIVSELFGKSYFTKNAILGSGPFNLFPPLTSVPMFVAGSITTSTDSSSSNQGQEDSTTTFYTKGNNNSSNNNGDNIESSNNNNNNNRIPYTALHCEPIGNVAVQLSGKKQWILVQPEYSYLLKPSVAPDGRAFFASYLSSDKLNKIPKYVTITGPGDAVWVPTWTWHRVNYIKSNNNEIAIGASLFHFRPMDFIKNNPLFATLIIPAILLELFGFSTQ